MRNRVRRERARDAEDRVLDLVEAALLPAQGPQRVERGRHGVRRPDLVGQSEALHDERLRLVGRPGEQRQAGSANDHPPPVERVVELGGAALRGRRARGRTRRGPPFRAGRSHRQRCPHANTSRSSELLAEVDELGAEGQPLGERGRDRTTCGGGPAARRPATAVSPTDRAKATAASAMAWPRSVSPRSMRATASRARSMVTAGRFSGSARMACSISDSSSGSPSIVSSGGPARPSAPAASWSVDPLVRGQPHRGREAASGVLFLAAPALAVAAGQQELAGHLVVERGHPELPRSIAAVPRAAGDPAGSDRRAISLVGHRPSASGRGRGCRVRGRAAAAWDRGPARRAGSIAGARTPRARRPVGRSGTAPP